MLWQHPAWVGLLAGVLALTLGSLSEYWIHRSLHRRGWARREHGEHHMLGKGRGWAGEFRKYLPLALPFCLLSFLPSLAIGVGFTAGALLYLAFAAYSHQVQHERPDLVFWMKAPVHHLHHRHHMTRHNYGIGVDIWDRWFGTLQHRGWNPKPFPSRWSDWVRIQWWGKKPALEPLLPTQDGPVRRGSERPSAPQTSSPSSP